MTQPITLFTGQWADLTLDEVASLAAKWGYDGLEIACSGEHLDVWAAAEDDAYLKQRKAILDKHGLKTWAISNHLTGQAVCDDPIDFRHQSILRSKVWGDGEAEAVDAARDFLLAHGCDMLQGWLYARALTPPALEAWLQQQG